MHKIKQAMTARVQPGGNAGPGNFPALRGIGNRKAGVTFPSTYFARCGTWPDSNNRSNLAGSKASSPMIIALIVTLSFF